MRRVAGSGERRSHAECINRRARFHQRRHFVFIEIAGRKYFHVVPTSADKFAANPAAILHKIAAIETNSSGLASHRKNFAQCVVNVVSIEQQHGVIGKRVEKVPKRQRLVLVRHHP